MRAFVLFVLLLFFAGTASVSGADRALVVGVDHYADPNVFNTDGAVADAKAIRQLLVDKLGFSPGSVQLLLNEEATARAITETFRTWLIEGSRPGDRVFFYYAGHGFQAPDDNGDEADGMDELVTPYDVKIGSQDGKAVLTDERTFIRDDRFNDFIVQLTGRRVVMMFDSCNSGTISRGVADGGKLLPSRYLRVKTTRSIADAGYSDVPKNGQPRDRSLVREESLTGKVNGILVITAASPYQQAFPMVTPDGSIRGAFTYSFEQLIKRNPQESLADLERDLKQEMKGLGDKGLIGKGQNGEFQVPQFDIVSKTEISNKPLFGSLSADNDFTLAAESALFNPLSPIKANLRVSRPRYRIGEEIRYSVEVSEDVYLYILVFSADNRAFCIFPTVIGRDTDNFVRRGTITFPRENYAAEASEPVGKDVWVALVSKQKLRLGEKQDYTWDEVFERIGLDELRKATFAMIRGSGDQRTALGSALDWQASSVVVETVAK